MIVVLGAGMAGLAAASRLSEAGRDVHVFEAKPHWGGHTHSTNDGGFVFDEGPHVSFTKDANVRALFERGAGSVEEFEAKISNAFQGAWVPHPAQCHLFGLSPDLVTRCIVDLASSPPPSGPYANYADWCVAMFGRTFAESFSFAYTRKYWTVEAEAMSTDWVGNRIYPPKLDEVVRGALDPANSGKFHYLTRFRYPSEGGYQSFMKGLYQPELISLDRKLVRCDLASRELEFADGSRATYTDLISTMPLPDLIDAIPTAQVPDEVRAASARLLCTALVVVDVAVSRADLSDHHWFYVYDEDISFARGHYPHMLSAKNAPPGHGSIQLEIYHSRHRALPGPREGLPARVVEELVRLKILKDEREVLWARYRDIPYANIVYDLARASSLDVILPWIKSHGIELAGRYGEWAYHWTDDAVLSGWKAAEALIGRG